MLTVTLEPSHQTFSLSKDWILSALPGSLLVSALEEDPNATALTLSHPDVTPEVMQFLVDYSQGIEPQHHIPSLVLADRYLNIPWLLYYMDPLYDMLPDRTNINNLANRPIIRAALRDNRSWFIAYLLAKGWTPNANDLAEALHAKASSSVVKLLLAHVSPPDALMAAVQTGQTDIVDQLLANPQTKPNETVFLAAVHLNYPAIVQRLLAYVNPAFDDNRAIKDAATMGFGDVVKVLLSDRRVDPAAEHDQALLIATQRGNLEMMRLLLAAPSTNPAIPLLRSAEKGPVNAVSVLVADPKTTRPLKDLALYTAAIYRQLDIVNLLLTNPEVNPAHNNNATIIAAAQLGNYTIVQRLMADPRVNPAAQDNLALREALAHNHPEVAALLRSDPRVRDIAR
jgi:ankyrin repeat protein